MPCDPYTETGYFETIRRIADAVKNNVAELVLMGINPTYPSAKYGYVVPVNDVQNKGIFQVSRFTEKPDMITAEKLISEGAFWNGGVFAFRLGYMTPKKRSRSQSCLLPESGKTLVHGIR